MRFEKQHSEEGEATIQVDITETADRGRSNLVCWGSTPFEPRETPSNPTESRRNGSEGSTIQAPERKLTLFALRLAILEKAATGLGTLAFIWATVVLLGGFASSLEKIDFWFVTIILLIEGTRIFSRSHQLEWQHEATWTLADAGRNSFQTLKSSSRFIFQRIKAILQLSFVTKPAGGHSRRIAESSNQTAREFQNQVSQRMRQRAWYTPNVPLISHAGWIFLLKNVSRILTCLQLSSATACVTLSLMRLIKQDYGEGESKNENSNKKIALNIFYGLALAEALMFLLEKAYWNWKVSYGRLLVHVSLECELGQSGIISIKRFFYDAYSKCINGSIFDGLKMDLVTFAQELLDSDFPDEQLIGAQILQKLVNSNQFASETLRKIGTSTRVIERLIDMLNWKNPAEEGMRRCAAEIVSKLSGKKENALRVGAIPGAMESISSLLYTGSHDERPRDVHQNSIIPNQPAYDFSIFNLLGLLVLKKLAHDHENCGKIGNARGLLSKIINFSGTSQSLLRDDQAPESQIKAVKRSLQVIKMLVSTTGNTGKMLRQAISEIVFTASNIRDILQYGESHMVLQKLGIEILQSLAMDENAKEKIGSTGGIIKLLLFIFFRPGFTEDEISVSKEAGEALAMLALESKRNCERILEVREVLDRLISVLNDPMLRVNATRILRNLCAYTATECCDSLRGVTAAMPTVLGAIMVEKDKLLEVSIGLTAQICKFMSSTEFARELEQAGIKETDLIQKLIEILNKYNHPEIMVPRIRRFVIELAIWMMQSDTNYLQLFKNSEMDKLLENVAETTSDLECYHVFSGSVGLSKHSRTLSSVVKTALELMIGG